MAAIESYTRTHYPVDFRTARIDDQADLYREARPVNAPAVLLLHGVPTSSKMFSDPVPRLAGSFRLIAPEYPERVTGLIVQNGNGYAGGTARVLGSDQEYWANSEESYDANSEVTKTQLADVIDQRC